VRKSPSSENCHLGSKPRGGAAFWEEEMSMILNSSCHVQSRTLKIPCLELNSRVNKITHRKEEASNRHWTTLTSKTALKLQSARSYSVEPRGRLIQVKRMTPPARRANTSSQASGSTWGYDSQEESIKERKNTSLACLAGQRYEDSRLKADFMIEMRHL
jgi:hypothetical protein